MRKLLILIALLLIALCSRPLRAQSQISSPPTIIAFAGVPSGACGTLQLGLNASNGNLYSCNGGAWAAVGGGVGTVTSVSGTANQIDVATGTSTPVISIDAALILPGTFSSAFTMADSLSPVASQSSLTLSGAPFTGGTGTTTFPLFYINDGTAPTTFATTGTEFGINAPSGFTGNFIDIHLNGAGSVFAVASSGTTTLGGKIQATAFANNSNSNHLVLSGTAPTIGTCGTSPSIVVQNGTTAFQVNVGTGGTATSCTVNMPAATTGWSCWIQPNAAPQAAAETFAVPTSTTLITFTNYTASTGVALAFASGAVFNLGCAGD